MKTFFSLLSAFVVVGSTNLQAQEAWLLEMPKKFGSYLLSKYQADEQKTVQDIIGKLPTLVEKKTIKEIESIEWEKPGKNHQAKSSYKPRIGTDKTQRSLTIQTPAAENSYTINSFGELGKSWTPTVVLVKGEQYLFLLERDASSPKETVATPNVRKFTYQSAEPGELTWYSSTPLDSKALIFKEVLDLKIAGRPAPVAYGVRVTAVLKKDAQSMVQLEISGKDSADPDTTLLHHNQAIFEGLSQLNGPLKKEVINVKSGEIKDAGEDGTWTITVEGE